MVIRSRLPTNPGHILSDVHGLSVCRWSRGCIVAKRLDRSRCRLACGVGWATVKAIADHIGPTMEMHIHSNSRGSTPGARRLHSAVNHWQPGPFAKLHWPLVIMLVVMRVVRRYIVRELRVCWIVPAN